MGERNNRREGRCGSGRLQRHFTNFDLVLPPNNIFGVDAGSYSPSAAIGIHLMLAPLSPGLHEIHVQAAFKNADTGGDNIIDVTYHLTVSS